MLAGTAEPPQNGNSAASDKTAAQAADAAASSSSNHALTPSHFVTEPTQKGAAQQSSDDQPPGPVTASQHQLASTDSRSKADPADSTDHPAGADDPSAESAAHPVSHPAGSAKQATMEALLEIYEEPDAYAGLYNYAKALEDVEAGLLAGFFFKHYCLASNVIGSQSKGTCLNAWLCTSLSATSYMSSAVCRIKVTNLCQLVFIMRIYSVAWYPVGGGGAAAFSCDVLLDDAQM